MVDLLAVSEGMAHGVYLCIKEWLLSEIRAEVVRLESDRERTLYWNIL